MWRRDDADDSGRVTVWWPLAVFYLAAAVFRERLPERWVRLMLTEPGIVLVAPFIRPPGGVGDTPPLPYYL